MSADFYHSAVLIAGAGVVITAAAWLPRLFSEHAPGATFLYIAGGAALFLLPIAPDVPYWVEQPLFWEKASELAVIAALFGTGLSIDRLGPWSRWSRTWRLLAITMPLTIFAMALLGSFWLGLAPAAAILLGAVLAPTDPVMAGDVEVEPPGKGGEDPVRFTLTTEAGFNDGLAFPFTYLTITVAAAGLGAWQEWGATWLLFDVFYRIVVGLIAGLVIGWAVGQLFYRFPRGRPLAASQCGLMALSCIFLSYGLTELIEGYGFLAAFAAGIALRRVEEDHEFNETLHGFTGNLEQTLLAVILIMLGAALPNIFSQLDWRHVGAAAALILVVRPLAGWIALLGHRCPRNERIAIAFFGVRGVGSIYYFAYATERAEIPGADDVLAVMTLAIVFSTLMHGLSASRVMHTLDARREAEGSSLGKRP